MSKVAGKGSSVVEYLVQVFFKQLDSQGVANKQVGCYIFFDGIDVLQLAYFIKKL